MHMLRHMRTTVRLDNSLLSQAKLEARRRGTTLTALIEQGLRLILRPSPPVPRERRIRLPVSRATGGTVPGIDLDDTSSVLDRMDGLD
jgi:hypothetical protein